MNQSLNHALPSPVNETERELWDQASRKYENFKLELGDHWTHLYRRDPRKLGVFLSKYKFSARMACKQGSTVLELGCGEGLGASILGEHAHRFVGVDQNDSVIQSARNNLNGEKYSFITDHYLGKTYGTFSTVIGFNVDSHLTSQTESLYFDTLVQNLAESGICLTGALSANQKSLSSEMARCFRQVFFFGMSDEMVHTALPNCDYVLCMGFLKK